MYMNDGNLLKEWERNFRPESMEKIDERYVEAVQNREKVEFQLDTLLWGTEDEKEAVIHDLGKGVEDIERMLMYGREAQDMDSQPCHYSEVRGTQ